MFICPNCDALYCQNCAHALESLENACWVCDGPIDPTKPVRSFHKEGDDSELKVSDKTQKFNKLT